MPGSQVSNIDIQFSKDWDPVKANQLVQSLQQLASAIRTLVNTSSAAAPAAGAVAKHELANQSGLGPDHTVAGLSADEVLIATAANAAHFAKLSLGQLAGTDAGTFAAPTNGEIVAFINGYWSALPFMSALGVSPPGADAVLMWDDTLNHGAGGFSWALPGTGIELVSGTIEALPPVVVSGDTPLTWLDM
jgi:hypothetical protein